MEIRRVCVAGLLAAVTGVAYAETFSVEAPFGTFKVEEATFPARDFVITDYGAKPKKLCTRAIAAAMEACEKAGGGRVVVPEGEWLTGAVRFRSNCNLFLEERALLEFTDDPKDYPVVETTWEGVECLNYSPLLYAYCCTNVAITGRGRLQPRMGRWRGWFGRTPARMKATEHLYHWCSTNAPMSARNVPALKDSNFRPQLIQFNRCRNVLVDGVRIRESPFWTIHLYHSEDCVLRNVDSVCRGANSDGLDIDMTRNVLVENCRFDQGDDGIVLKAGRNADAWRLNRPTENVVIRDCDLVRSHSLLGIGSELSGGIRNVWMTRCRVDSTGGMIRIKTNRRRGGFVENVWLDHCQGGEVSWVANIATDVFFQWAKFPDYERRLTRIRGIHLSDVTVDQAGKCFDFVGDPGLEPEDIEMRNVRIGRATKSFKTVRNCRNVRFDNVVLDQDVMRFCWPEYIKLPVGEELANRSPAHAVAVAFANRTDLGTLKDGRYELGKGVVATVETRHFVPFAQALFRTDRTHDTLVVLPDKSSVERFLVGRYATNFTTWDEYCAFLPAGVPIAEGLCVGDPLDCRRVTITVPVEPQGPKMFTPTGFRRIESDLVGAKLMRDGDALAVSGGLPERAFGWASEKFAVTPGTWFHFTGRIATSNLQHSARLDILYYGKDGRKVREETLVSQWGKNMEPRRLHVVRCVPEGAVAAEVRAYMRGTGWARFDQISIDESTDDWQDETDGNRLLNGSFEEADLCPDFIDAWTLTRGAATRTTAARHGTYGIRLASGAALGYGGTNAFAIAVRGGETLKAHAAAKGEGTLALTWTFKPSGSFVRRIGPSSDWRDEDFDVKVPADARTASLEIAAEGGAVLADALYCGCIPYADAKKGAVVPDVPVPEKCVKMPRSEVKDYRGVPTWYIDGKPIVDSMYTFRGKPGQAAHGVRYHRRVIETGRFPLYVIGEHVNADEVGPESLAEFLEIVDHQVRLVMSSCPDARFLVWYQQYPTRAFAREYPDELGRVEDTDQGFEKKIPGYSYGSEIWSKFCERSVKRFFEEIGKRPYADRIVGFMPGFGNFGENNYGHIDGKYYLSPHDFSPAMSNFFRKWLLREYGGDVAAFDAAWGRTGFDFAHAQVPAMLQRSPTRAGAFLDIAVQRQTVDYARCESYALLWRVDRQCRAAKEATDGRVFTASELGYLWGRHYHREMMPILNSPWLDAFGPAPGYLNRGPGDDIPAFAPVASLKAHNKVYLFQADVRTHVEPGAAMRSGETESAAESVGVLYREMGKYMTDGEIPYHWTFGKWYNDLAIYAAARNYERLMRLSGRFPRQSVAEVAEVLDPLSLSAGIQYRYGTEMATAGRFFDYNRRLEWLRLGAPRDLWLLDDLLTSDKLAQYKVVILHGVCALTTEQRRLIRERLCRDGRTVIWMYAPPVFAADGTKIAWSLENGKDAGFAFEEKRGDFTLLIKSGEKTFGWSQTGIYGGLGVPANYKNPKPHYAVRFQSRFSPQPTDGVKVFGRYADDGSPAAAMRETKDCREVFWGSVMMEREVLARLAAHAGVHLYVDRPAVVYANGNFGCVHVKEPGPVKVSLPRTAEVVVDLVTEKTIAENASSFDVDLAAKSTLLFYFGDRAEYERASADVKAGLATRDAELERLRPQFAYEAVKTNLAAVCALDTPEPVDAAGFVRDWLFLGPFESKAFEGYAKDYLGGEAAARPKANEKVGDCAWLPRRMSAGRVLAISNQVSFPFINNLAYYLFTTVISPDDREVILSVGADDGEKTWLNGRLETQMDARGRSCTPESEMKRVRLNKGENTLLVKITQGSGNNGHAIRFLDPETERPVTDLKTVLR